LVITLQKILRKILRHTAVRLKANTPEFLRNIIKPGYDQVLTLLRRKNMIRDRKAILDLIEYQKGDKQLIIFAPSLDWNVQLFQRPQQLAMAFARKGLLVLYLQPEPDHSLPSFQEIIPNLFLGNVFVQACDVLDCPIVYFLTWNCGHLQHFNSPRLIYDMVDDIKVFYADQKLITKYHYQMLKEADLVLVTAQKLLEEVKKDRTDAVYCPNGVDFEHFQLNGNQPIPPDLESILAQRKPVIGYYGALAYWFDYELLKFIAASRPNFALVLIGPDYDGSIKSTGIDKIGNIFWLGVKPYDVLPLYLRSFDVTIIPFQLNDITHATSPLKLFEYMAGGKPVVITPMHESMGYEGVLVGWDAEDFVAKLDEALRMARNPVYLSLLERIARENTWDARAGQILDELKTRKIVDLPSPVFNEYSDSSL
jgi:glycosyltransferase involved in cell wall biosynthesis